MFLDRRPLNGVKKKNTKTQIAKFKERYPEKLASVTILRKPLYILYDASAVIPEDV
jgi:hypothetical protein